MQLILEEARKIIPPNDAITDLRNIEIRYCYDHEKLKMEFARILTLRELDIYTNIDERCRKASKILITKIESGNVKCLFNQSVCCTYHNCKKCSHLPELDNMYFSLGDKTDYERMLQTAIGASRQKHENRISDTHNIHNKKDIEIKKLPDWIKDLITDYGFDIPCRDHAFIMKNDEAVAKRVGEYTVVSEPYHIWLDQLNELYLFCKDRGLECDISGRASHYPGGTVRIEITKKLPDVDDYNTLTYCIGEDMFQNILTEIQRCKISHSVLPDYKIVIRDSDNKEVDEIVQRWKLWSKEESGE
jgi:hypothetical protein